MSRFILTIFENTLAEALAAVRGAPSQVHGFEIRLDALRLPIRDLAPLREATWKQLILTRRSIGTPTPFTREEIHDAVAAGFDLVDVELSGDLCPETLVDLGREVILSHHDFEGVTDLNLLYRRMKAFPAERRKIAVTPTGFQDNERVLTLAAVADDPALTVIGMGTGGLYSRILAPFFGSELVFVAKDDHSLAAPGQLTVRKAMAIYGDDPSNLSAPDVIFAVIGNPVSHSHSPEIHNPLFRAAGAPAAYSMIEVEAFEEVARATADETAFAPAGLSITAPFKEDAWEFARRVGASITPRAARCRAVNTLVRVDGELVADNTDVAGFARALDLVSSSDEHVALIGAGGAARAALVALLERGFRVTIYNRATEKAERLAREFSADAAPLAALPEFRGAVVINSLPGDVELAVPARPGGVYIDVSYADAASERTARARSAGMRVFDGMDFLRAQAVPQSELFLRAARVRRGAAQ